MTHYMELLATNQPWNLLIFMAIPIVLAETMCSIVVGIYFLGIFFYLLKAAVIPISNAGAWRGIADVIAVGFYLLAVVPLFGLTLVDLNVIGRDRKPHDKMAIHATLVAIQAALSLRGS